ncbi:MAG TPA: hypothetical protein VNL36_02175 [Bacteroidota bacterium]|nr:hypothetical protein [Bacteroidota bacterium]
MQLKVSRNLVLFLFALGVLAGCTDLGVLVDRDDYISYPRDIHAAWSPDGKWIVYRHEDYTKYDSTYPNGLYLIDPAGNNRRLLLEGEGVLPAWSPNGQWIAYTDGVLFVMNVRLKETRPLTDFLTFFPTWSPDGMKLAFDTPFQDPRGANVIWIINADGTGLRDISQHGVGEWRMPAWSPNGSIILHTRYLTGVLGQEIYLMDTSGQAPVRLTYNGSDDRYPKWSADGSMIAWTMLPPRGTFEVWIMKNDGTQQKKLTNGTHPSFSPDSRTIVFSDFNLAKNKIVLWRIDVDGRNLKQLTH